jgi:hypothetical protein
VVVVTRRHDLVLRSQPNGGDIIVRHIQAPSIAEAQSFVLDYGIRELAEILAAVDNSGGLDAYGIASSRELGRRILNDPVKVARDLLSEVLIRQEAERREQVQRNVETYEQLARDGIDMLS